MLALSNQVVSVFVTTWTIAQEAPWNSPVKNIGVGCHSLPYGILPNWGSSLYC